MKAKVKYKELTTNLDGSVNIVFCAEKGDALALRGYIEKRAKKDEEYPFAIELSKWRDIRSLSANNYFWQLCDKLSEALSSGKSIVTREELYRRYIRENGAWRDIVISSEAVSTLKFSWGLQGIGWFAEEVDECGVFTTVRLFYGSSSYNVARMKRLIDAVVQDAEAIGIDTRTPSELAELLSLVNPYA